MYICALKTAYIEREEEKADCTTTSTNACTPPFYKQDEELCTGRNFSLVKSLLLHSSHIYFP